MLQNLVEVRLSLLHPFITFLPFSHFITAKCSSTSYMSYIYSYVQCSLHQQRPYIVGVQEGQLPSLPKKEGFN